MGILALGERQRVRLFVRRDPFERFVSCLVVPSARPLQHREPRARSARSSREAFGGDARRLDAAALRVGARPRPLHRPLERGRPIATTTSPRSRRGSSQATRAWTDDLRDALLEELRRGARAPSSTRATRDAFPPAYRADWVARAAVADIDRDRGARGAGELASSPLPPARGAPSGSCRCKLFSAERRSRCPTCCRRSSTWARASSTSARTRSRPRRRRAGVDLRLRRCAARRERRSSAVRERFQEAFLGVWRGELENDRLNALVLARRPERTRGHGRCARSPATCARPGIAFSDALHGAHAARPPARSPRCWSSCSARASIPTRRDAERRAAARGGDRARRSTRSRASTRTGSCAASWRSCAR